MGRLRNLSASFKAATFQSNNNTTTTTTSPASSNGKHRQAPLEPVVAGKEHSTTTRDVPVNNFVDLPTTQSGRGGTKPTQMVYNPPTMTSGTVDDVEELKPVFSYLSSHSNKLYQEGYFLKLDDLDTHGKPNGNRNWTECFAQLVGTVLSLWDAAALDAAGQDGEVAPSFINLADASIKMIETLPTRNQDVQPLQNVLSISTAGKNRYLFHFNSLHSLTQWTSGIRLAMFEHASLQELYTGSLIAGKGRTLNSINQIMAKNKFRIEDWCRVRFGAGTPWRRCWCVIEPPDEKEWQKSSKSLKKRSVYEKPTYPKGDIRFYDTKKIKKGTMPIATITDAYSAYAIYPQSKPLINESTLVKVEGRITIHSTPESKTEGFVFVMPEVHPAVSGFEMMLRWLLPVYDTFSLYGRPTRLIPDTLDTRSLMFAMPRERRYGYLDIIDISALIHTEGSDRWSEREWRKRMKESSAKRMGMIAPSRTSNIEKSRTSLGSRPGVRYGDSVVSLPRAEQNQSTDAVFEVPKKVPTAPPAMPGMHHSRSASESVVNTPSKPYRQQPREYVPSRLSEDREVMPIYSTPLPPKNRKVLNPRINESDYVDSANSSDSEMQPRVDAREVQQDMMEQRPPAPVATPSFQHSPNDRPQKRPDTRPEMRREKSRMSNATLSQMVDASKLGSATDAGAAAAAAWRQNPRYDDHDQGRGVNKTPDRDVGDDTNSSRKAMVTDIPPRSNSGQPSVTCKSLPRTTSENSVKRKPVPNQQLVVPERSNSPSSNYSNPNHERDSSPDYASIRKSVEKPPMSLPKTRGGIRKVIGNPAVEEKRTSDIPDIDFGMTESLTPSASRPVTPAGRKSPFESLSRPVSVAGRRTPYGTLTPPSNPHSPADEKQSYLGRSVSHPWQPGSTVVRQSSGVLSPEEFVQQRAAIAQIPSGYVAHRTTSSGKIDQHVEERPSTPKKLQKKRASYRSISHNSSVDYSSNLSAREQEHVARMTGGPLLNVGERSKTPDPSVGLIGAIEAREQEKRNIKEGVSGHMVQAAIEQRQRESRSQYQYMQNQYIQQNSPYGHTPVQWGAAGYGPQQFYGPPQAYQGTFGPPSPSNPQGYNQQHYSGFYAPHGQERR